MSDDDILACLRLSSVRGVGAYTANRLLSSFSSAAAFWQADPALWRQQEGIGEKLAEALQQSQAASAIATLELCQQSDIQVLCRDDPDWPVSLKGLDDAPLLLFFRGHQQALSAAHRLAVVGARKASTEGRKLTRQWCQQLSQQSISIISGMAYGVDTAAHGGALSGSTSTIAVLGCGLNTLYPLQQQQQQAIIDAGGAIVSEYLPQQSARPEHFPQRNRIIAALAQAVLVMEADVASGSLITARHAAQYGREVMAVPGSVLGCNHAGCHQLIRDGAQLVESPADVLQHMQWCSPQDVPDPATLEQKVADYTPLEQQIIRLLYRQVLHIDQLAEQCQLPVQTLAPTLLSLELLQLIESLPGGRYGLVLSSFH